jgi:hypothetical protein
LVVVVVVVAVATVGYWWGIKGDDDRYLLLLSWSWVRVNRREQLFDRVIARKSTMTSHLNFFFFLFLTQSEVSRTNPTASISFLTRPAVVVDGERERG